MCGLCFLSLCFLLKRLVDELLDIGVVIQIVVLDESAHHAFALVTSATLAKTILKAQHRKSFLHPDNAPGLRKSDLRKINRGYGQIATTNRIRTWPKLETFLGGTRKCTAMAP